jgi:hypothetical protein
VKRKRTWLLILGVAFAGLGVFRLLGAVPVLAQWNRTTAQVVERQDVAGRSYDVVLEHSGGVRTRQRLESQRRGSYELQVGQRLEIVVDRADPQRIELLTIQAPWVAGLVFTLFGAALLVVRSRIR